MKKKILTLAVIAVLIAAVFIGASFGNTKKTIKNPAMQKLLDQYAQQQTAP
ncbi:MAG: hypothetical protein LBS90_05855 [Oscillospiraceae bacterium]|jgi:hypothetical protein|nr:hypothetical protein [Oscillospiraceae bacterium]